MTETMARPPLIVRCPTLLQLFALGGHFGEESRRHVLDMLLHEPDLRAGERVRAITRA